MSQQSVLLSYESQLILQNNNLRSENCILNSGSANDINKYNQCIANQMQMARTQNLMELEYLRNEIIKLNIPTGSPYIIEFNKNLNISFFAIFVIIQKELTINSANSFSILSHASCQ